MSYIGLFSLLTQFDNWAYQPSYVSSNTPLVFSNGVRVQIFPTEHLKIEPWFNERLAVLWEIQQPAPGWDSRFCGGRMAGSPRCWANQYLLGRRRFEYGRARVRLPTRTNSIEVKYYDNKEKIL